MRSVRLFDTAEPFDGTPDERRHLFYSADWRLLEERIDEGWTSGFTADVIAQNFWGVRHLDDAVMRRRGEVSDPWDTGFLSRHYHLTDVQFSTVALIDSAGVIVERVRYGAYGDGRHSWPHDVDGDGDADTTGDRSIISTIALGGGAGIGSGSYNVDADLNMDGAVNLSDVAAWNGIGAKAALVGRISDPSGPDNATGFAGYHFDRESGLYQVRNRSYDTILGRFIERDPIGYADGMSLYEYVKSSPFVLADPFGLGPEWGAPYIVGKDVIRVAQIERSKSFWLGAEKTEIVGHKDYVGTAIVPGTGGRSAEELLQARGYGGLQKDVALAGAAEPMVDALNEAFHGRGVKEAASMARSHVYAQAIGGTALSPASVRALTGDMGEHVAKFGKAACRESAGDISSGGTLFNQGARAHDPVDPKLLESLRKRGYDIDQSAEAVRYLDARGANAATFGNKDILARPDARHVEIVEEYLHNVQRQIGLTDRLTPGATGGLEIHAKDFMVRHHRMLGISQRDAEWLGG